ncbi:hypothetical protein HOLleu_20471 [Holothuria leucospilota]|uniref:HTH CENPB-type domain-containing protein n=1 Tax=Holothuria leucospilota TaxID=206669 RepID=A0A9Q1H8R5_HOLLE|nr:hypothetical protein HOLleu_20471 [Holothuria leucospilota]
MLRRNTTEKYRKYTQATLELAFAKIKNGEMTLRQAARLYSVPKSTLNDKLKGRVQLRAKSGPMTNISNAEEDRLESWLLKMSQIGYGQTKRELKSTVKKILDEDQRTTMFKDNLPGCDWFERFLARHPKISERCGEALGKERAVLNTEKIDTWYHEFYEYMTKDSDLEGKGLEIFGDPRRIFNCNESGFPLSGKTEKVLAPGGSRNVYQLVVQQ